MLAYALTAGRRAGVPGLSAARARGRALSQTVRLVFVDTDGSEIPVDAAVGKSLLEVAHANDIELEGACDGSLACSTCHLILDEESFKKLQPPGEEELDMLDLAFDLQKTCAPPPGSSAGGIRLCRRGAFARRGGRRKGGRARLQVPSRAARPLLAAHALTRRAPSLGCPRAARSSRLGCQVKASPELEGMRCRLPSGSNNMQ